MLKDFVKKSSLKVNNQEFQYYPLNEAAKKLGKDISKLPFSLKVLFENLIRNYDGEIIKEEHLSALIDSNLNSSKRIEISFSPARVLMQDFTGVPAVVDLASMREAVKKTKHPQTKINPLIPVDLVIDHSVQVDHYGNNQAFEKNVAIEVKRNHERYEFLKWAQESFDNFRIVPPGTGICHQVNLENLAKVVWSKNQDNQLIAYPDTVVGTDSHTTMINGLSVLGWGVGGIEAEAAMLGQPISMLIPEVIGFRLTGQLSEGVTATDLVLTVTNILRKQGVVGKFVEFFGKGVKSLSLANRATIANMAPEYGATCGIFAIDEETINYLKLTNRDQTTVELVEKYAKLQGMFADDSQMEPQFSEIIELDLSTVESCLAGPKRPQDRINLAEVASSFNSLINQTPGQNSLNRYPLADLNSDLGNGDIIIAAITSCTNTSNPEVIIAAGLLAKKAAAKGLKAKPYVKTSLAPGSQVVSEYLANSGLQQYLDQVGFNLVGYGCTTCIGNSGPIDKEIEETVKNNNLLVAAILSGNRNFEGRIHPLTKANYLASPPLVVAYAIAGNINIDLKHDPIGVDSNGQKVYLKDIWPSNEEIDAVVKTSVNKEIFAKKYHNLFDGNSDWQNIKVKKSDVYSWNESSTYIRLPGFFDHYGNNAKEVKGARILAMLGDSITTDHISPAGNIASNSPAASYLKDHGIAAADFNSYGARRGNHEVMMRGTFANIRIKNEVTTDQSGSIKEGGYAKIFEENKITSIYEAAMYYKAKSTPLVIIAGKEYGTGSSRDWAAKGPYLLGIKAVIAESFERIHRSNLIGMGILPLIFKSGQNRKILNLIGNELIDILGIDENIKPKQDFRCLVTKADGSKFEITLTSAIDTGNEIEYYKSGGILQYVISRA